MNRQSLTLGSLVSLLAVIPSNPIYSVVDFDRLDAVAVAMTKLISKHAVASQKTNVKAPIPVVEGVTKKVNPVGSKKPSSSVVTQCPPAYTPAAGNQIKAKTRNWGKKFDAVKQLFGRIQKDRSDLNALREKHIARYNQEKTKPLPQYSALMKDITNDTIVYINSLVSDTLKKLGPAPTRFCIFSLGSLARQESGFFTDLEIGIILDKKTTQAVAFFKKFAQELADRIFLLGEHPDVGGKGMRLDEADNSPIHNKFFARYASPSQIKSLLREAIERRAFENIPTEGSRLFITTPEELASHLNAHYLDILVSGAYKKYANLEGKKLFDSELAKALKNPAYKGMSRHDILSKVDSLVQEMTQPYSARERRVSDSIANLSRNITCLYGDKSLFNRYKSSREAFLNGVSRYQNPNYTTRRQEIAYCKMREDISRYLQKADKSSVVQGKLQKEIDIKRELYRFTEQLLTNLGFWYNVQVQNTLAIARALAEKGVISASLSNRLVDLMNFCMGMRLRKQEKMRRQTWAVPVTLEEFQDQEKKLTQELANLRISRTMLTRSHGSRSELDALDHKILKADGALRDLQKMRLMSPDSILGPKEIEALNGKYLPFLKQLFETEQSFLEGNKQAFANLR